MLIQVTHVMGGRSICHVDPCPVNLIGAVGWEARDEVVVRRYRHRVGLRPRARSADGLHSDHMAEIIGSPMRGRRAGTGGAEMMVSPVLGSRGIFDQSEHGSPMVGPLVVADVVVGGGALVGGIGRVGAGRGATDGGVATGAGGVGEALTGRPCCW